MTLDLTIALYGHGELWLLSAISNVVKLLIVLVLVILYSIDIFIKWRSLMHGSGMQEIMPEIDECLRHVSTITREEANKIPTVLQCEEVPDVEQGKCSYSDISLGNFYPFVSSSLFYMYALGGICTLYYYSALVSSLFQGKCC